MKYKDFLFKPWIESILPRIFNFAFFGPHYMSVSTTPVIQLEKVFKRFKYLLAANNISFEIQKNEIIALIGPNGAGKSTILNLIAGVIKPTHGEVKIKNINILKHTSDFKKNIILFSYYSFLYDDLTGLENLLFWLKLYDCQKHKAMNMTLKDYILDKGQQFGIKNWLYRPVRELSTGMRKKIDFMRAILIEPEFLLLDEPFSGMDPKNIEFFVKIIQDYRNKGTICIVSHDIDIISSLCDRVLIINKGRLIEQVVIDKNLSREQIESKLLEFFDFSN